MIFDFHPEAHTELFKAIDYYELCEDNLGYDFAFDGDIRRCLTNRFPYGILYSIESDRIFILAVMHLHRDPDYWKHRME